MRLLVDALVPAAKQLFAPLGELQMLPGRAITNQHCASVEALIVRSTTAVTPTLLAGSSVQFVGSTTAGIDHIDTHWLQQQGITFSHAPGCNAIAVVEYVLTALLWLAQRKQFALPDKTVGIVGVGHIGSLLQQRLQLLGVNTLLCDPPRQARGDPGPFWPLSHLVQQADILTFHVPLQRTGPDATWHLVDSALLAALPPQRILINSSRGAVIDNAALLAALNRGKSCSVILDVWEQEPALSLPLLKQTTLATAHIAGYTLEARFNGVFSIYRDLCQHYGLSPRITDEALLPVNQKTVTLSGPWHWQQLIPLTEQLYSIARDDSALRRLAHRPGGFDWLRAHYPERRQWSSLRVACDNQQTAEQLQQLGFRAYQR
ncbi:MAG: 4-phosphoerythronate dehydrogenase [Candidatus Symbiodolus clandestinus]